MISDENVEQEITGDVLLELDANVLKSEIGIMAYGKRVRIANAIAELRRPSSFEFPAQRHSSSLPSPVYSSSQFHADGSVAPMVHARMKSQSQHSHHSLPAASGASILTKHKYSQSMQSSIGSAPGFIQQRHQDPVPEVAVPSQVESGQQDDAISTNTSVGLGINLISNGVRNYSRAFECLFLQFHSISYLPFHRQVTLLLELLLQQQRFPFLP